MSDSQNTTTPAAIPTEYKGIQFKSRFEAQAAYLFDCLGWEWEYEPKSFMLPNGVAYTPDFLIRSQGTFIECRGYWNEKGEKQLSGFIDLVDSGLVIDGNTDAPVFIRHYVILCSSLVIVAQHRNDVGWCAMLIYCDRCQGWRLTVNVRCPNCGKDEDISRSMVLTTKAGKLFLNQRSSEHWNDVLGGANA